MIFATVGTQLPFPRLLNALDNIAGRHGLEVIAQTADPDYLAGNLTTYDQLAPQRFDEIFTAADLIVAHAGIGTLLTAIKREKPLIFFPRQASLNEHRNDHQMATVRDLQESNNFYVATDEASLETLIVSESLVPIVKNGSSQPRDQLIERIRSYMVG